MKKVKLVIAIICAGLVIFGIGYRLTVWPFSSPMFDLISWIAIGAAFVILAFIARSGK